MFRFCNLKTEQISLLLDDAGLLKLLSGIIPSEALG
jgi:hypothetical protein